MNCNMVLSVTNSNVVVDVIHIIMVVGVTKCNIYN